MKLGVPVSVMLGFANGPALLEAVKNGALFVCEIVTSWPASASDAEPVTETDAFSLPLAVAAAVMTGFVLVRPIVSAVVADAVPAGTFTSEADQLTVKLPVWAPLGVPLSVMLGARAGPALLEAVKNGALFVCDNVTFCASGSEAEPVTETSEPVEPLAVAGAVITGTRLTFVIVTVVATGVAVPAGTFASTAVQFTV